MTNTILAKQLADLGIKEPIETTIGEDLEFHGKLVIKNGSSIAIFGKVEGEIDSDGTVVVGKSGIVKGTLSANVVAVAGTVDNHEGADNSIHARVALILGSTARIGSKTVNYGAIEMERGCRIDGTLKFVEPPKELAEKYAAHEQAAADAKPPVAGIPASLQQAQGAPQMRPLPVITPADRGVAPPAQPASSPVRAGAMATDAAPIAESMPRPVAA